MSATRYFLKKCGLTIMVPLGLAFGFVLFTYMPALAQTEGIIRTARSTSPFASLLLICMGAQILIAAGLGIYFLRRLFSSGPRPTHLSVRCGGTVCNLLRMAGLMSR